MSKIHVKYKHALNPQETRNRVEEIAKDLKKEYKIDYAWKGDRLLFRRSGAAGNLDLGDSMLGVLNHSQLARLPDKRRCAILHMSLFSEGDGRLLAEIFTVQGETGTLRVGDPYLNVDLKMEWGY